ncbi:MAG: ribosome assembly RNA-binding protein YhbY [Betaproteobacteria bacterium]|nr:ribosome assembly RNA-binding protein YhbY [Betaproteobacteria bacterium]
MDPKATSLNPAERRALRARAHALKPVVLVGNDGLSEAVLKEVDRSLTAHELIKIRVAGQDRDQREAMLEAVCRATGAAAVQHIGNILVLYRPAPEAVPAAVPRRRPTVPAKDRAAPVAAPSRPASAPRRPRRPPVRAVGIATAFKARSTRRRTAKG